MCHFFSVLWQSRKELFAENASVPWLQKRQQHQVFRHQKVNLLTLHQPNNPWVSTFFQIQREHYGQHLYLQLDSLHGKTESSYQSDNQLRAFYCPYQLTVCRGSFYFHHHKSSRTYHGIENLRRIRQLDSLWLDQGCFTVLSFYLLRKNNKMTTQSTTTSSSDAPKFSLLFGFGFLKFTFALKHWRQTY